VKGNGRRGLDETRVVVSLRAMRAALVGAWAGTPAESVCGAATLDRQHGMAAPLSGRQPELIPTSHLSTSDGDRKADRAHRQHQLGPACQESAGLHRPDSRDRTAGTTHVWSQVMLDVSVPGDA
jgi:hypothetical protein